jgi:hypothetical protein
VNKQELGRTVVHESQIRRKGVLLQCEDNQEERRVAAGREIGRFSAQVGWDGGVFVSHVEGVNISEQ